MTLEERVLKAIAGGHTTFTAIDTSARNETDGTGNSAFRKTDRVLQRLKRRGVLRYSRKDGWSIVKDEGGG